MGMFDSLHVYCQCGASVELQSKAGDCVCANYVHGVDTCPPSIAGDLIGQHGQCECGRSFIMRGAVVLLPEWKP